MSVLLDDYTDAALPGDRAGAAGLATDFAGRDESCLRVVTQLLAPSQRDVGARWLRGDCTVADEHRATFVTESVLSSLAVGSRGALACRDGGDGVCRGRVALSVNRRPEIGFLYELGFTGRPPDRDGTSLNQVLCRAMSFATVTASAKWERVCCR